MTDEEALARINECLRIDARVTFDGVTLKCCLRDEDGGTDKAYLDAFECMQLGAAFAKLAQALRSGGVER